VSFVMIAAGVRQPGRVRTLSARRALAAAVLASTVLLTAGGALGYWLASSSLQVATPVDTGTAAPAHPFALEQIGDLSARLFTLESQAAQLGARIGLLPARTPKAAAGSGDATAAGVAPPPGRLPARPVVGGRHDGGAPAALAPPEAAADAGPKPPASGGPLLEPRPLTELTELPGLDTLDEQLAALESRIDLVADAVALRHADQMRLPSQRPVGRAELVSAFGNRRDPFSDRLAFHAGMDFAAPHGAPILSAGGGVVEVAGFRPDYGWTVEIDHGNGLRTRYAHASKLLVRRGAVVAPGERIALVGSTGRSTGPHLHFEVLRDGRQVDPRRYLAVR
jgi:murein DD-endopeptidase MepM/ murein hydrolase activator NlpD